MRAIERTSWTLALAALLAAPLSGQPVPLAEAFEVHNDVGGEQRHSAVAVADSEAFLVVWETTNAAGGAALDIAGRKFQSNGTPFSEFRLNQTIAGPQEDPRLAMNGSGDYAVTWRSQPDQDGNRQVRLRSSRANGTLIGDESQANATLSTNGFLRSQLCSFANDRFVVVWDLETPKFRLFDGSGAPLTGDLEATTDASAELPAVGCLGGGGLVVVWQDLDAQGFGVFARLFSDSGSPVGASFRVNEVELDFQKSPLVAAAASGGFIVAWLEETPNGDQIEFRRFTDDGVAVGGDRLVALDETTFDLALSGLEVSPDGAMLLTVANFGGTPLVRALEFSRTGAQLPGGPTTPAEDPSSTALEAGIGRKTYVLTWTQNDTVSDNVFARRYLRRAVFSDDFEAAEITGWSTVAN